MAALCRAFIISGTSKRGCFSAISGVAGLSSRRAFMIISTKRGNLAALALITRLISRAGSHLFIGLNF